MVTYAVTLSDLIEKGGAYAGLAAFFGFAVLSVLAFAQAREIRRLRDWAGRAPERAQELEQRVVQQAEQARRVQATPSRRPGQPVTAAAKAVPASAAAKAAPALADAPTTAQPAVAEDAEPAAEPAPAAEAKPAAEPAADAPAEPSEDAAKEEPVVASAATDAPAADEEKSEETSAVPVGAATAATTATPAVTPANGAGDAPPSKLPPRATQGPATAPVRRPAPAAQPLRASQPPSRRPAPAVTQDEPSGRRTGIVVAGVAAGLILIVIALLAIFTGGDDNGPKQASSPTTQQPADTPAETTTPKDDGGKKEAPANRADTTVAVLNGTTVAGLAGTVDTTLTEAGYTEAQTPTNYTDQARSASVVFYNGSANRTQAIAIGKLLDVSDVRPIESAASALAPGSDVVVVVGADQTP